MVSLTAAAFGVAAHLGYKPRTTAEEGLPALMSELRIIHDRMKSAT